MIYSDFEYDGICLSDMGYVICNFGSSNFETISNGSKITFNTVPSLYGYNNELTSTKYEEYLTATFQICKHSCISDKESITISESREIMRWLNRKEFCKLKFLNDKDMEMQNIFFEASFNISKIEFNGSTYGFELEMITNRPFALHEPINFILEYTTANETKEMSCISDEIGYIYPEMEITINEIYENNTSFEMYSNLEDRLTRIKNCKAGEVIKFNYPVIESNIKDHKIQNDFNWVFFRLSNTFRNRINKITTSLPCSIKLKYCPIVKIGI